MLMNILKNETAVAMELNKEELLGESVSQQDVCKTVSSTTMHEDTSSNITT